MDCMEFGLFVAFSFLAKIQFPAIGFKSNRSNRLLCIFKMAIQFVLLPFFALFFTSATSLMCFNCTEDCTMTKIPLIECEPTETHCVTYEIDRYSVIRGCYLATGLDDECTLESQAEMKCQKCNTDKCNMNFQEPLICRSCIWTPQTMCPIRHRCHIPFGTHHVQCYIVYDRLQGYHYGCSYDAPSDVQEIMKKDEYHIIHMKCDAHDCNDEVRFLPAKFMFEPFRICYACEGTYCGMLRCKDPSHRFGMFCYTDGARGTSGCMSDLSDLDIVAAFESRWFLICAQSECNKKLEPSLLCHDQHGYPRYCFAPDDHCVSFKEDDSDQYQPLGCKHNSPCYDRKRCYVCNRNACNDKKIDHRFVQCYKCKDETGCRKIRDQQVTHVGVCYNSKCAFFTDGEQQMRDCNFAGMPSANWKVTECEGSFCNQFPTTSLCYECNENSRECIYSQDQLNFVSCAPGVESCFINDRGDGRVERGCGLRTGPFATVCHNGSLCNDKSTVSHACHIYETDFEFHMNLEPPVVSTKFDMGWTPNVCSDIDGHPACYMSYHKEGMVWGCLGDTKNYKESYYGAQASDTFLSCEGHYCNYFP